MRGVGLYMLAVCLMWGCGSNASPASDSQTLPSLGEDVGDAGDVGDVKEDTQDTGEDAGDVGDVSDNPDGSDGGDVWEETCHVDCGCYVLCRDGVYTTGSCGGWSGPCSEASFIVDRCDWDGVCEYGCREDWVDIWYRSGEWGAEDICRNPPLQCPEREAVVFGEAQRIEYGDDPAQVMDVYLPEAEYSGDALPVFVWLAADTWPVDQEHTEIPAAVLGLQERGVVVGVMRTRGRDTEAPATMFDARQGIRWLREHAESLHINPEKIGVGGFGEGGYLAAILATASQEGTLDPLPSVTSPHVAFAVPFAAPLAWSGARDDSDRKPDACQESQEPCTSCAGSIMSELFDCPQGFESCPERAHMWNPSRQSSQNRAAMLLVHGTEDCTVYPHHSQQMRSRSRARLVEVQGVGHALDELWTDVVISEFTYGVDAYLLECTP